MEYNYEQAAARIVSIIAGTPPTISEEEAKNVLYPALQKTSVLVRILTFERWHQNILKS